MPDPEISMVLEYVTVWDVAALKDRFGENTVYEPRQIRVRWEDTNREVIDPTGASVAVDAVVYVTESITIGSMLYRSPLASLPATFSVKRVVRIEDVQDIKGRATQRCLFLMKQSETLPTIVGTGS